MKYILCLFLLLNFSVQSKSQCIDIYGRQSDCPTADDSLVVYNNALKVYEFYEKNPDYVKLKSVKLKTRQEVINCFYSLQDAVDTFNIRWQLRERVLKGEFIPSVLLPRDGKNIALSEYYQYLDAYRFYQRELENGILNINSPFPIYDIRISPLVVNSYENRFGRDGFNGDFVNVALYIPVTVKPYKLLTEEEKVIREQILKGVIPKKIVPKTNKVITPTPPPKSEMKEIIKDTTPLPSANIEIILPSVQKQVKMKTNKIPNGAIPFYIRNGSGGGCLIGYMIGRKFRKYLPTDEFYNEAVPTIVKEFLNNDIQLDKYLRIQFGAYYNGFYED